ncbi:MAG: NADH dehydrogenase subunit [Bacteroidota bacterium]|nr:NADH dehydrogenase subunit [Bacteroidota bacterium]MDP4204805.1 NADH dehydrogenase subunit [Bacteroidota bacterium]
MNYISIYNNQTIALNDIPVLGYKDFRNINLELLSDQPERHCVSYFGYKDNDKIKLFCCIADDATHQIYVSSSMVDMNTIRPSFSAQNHNFEKFEREIHENFGIPYSDHPWLKPYRYSHNRYDENKTIENYPFYKGQCEELHEVGVGPIHAGIIEPGHFRFICNGEQIMHLEIQFGYQHRGIEQLFLQKKKLLERTTLAESIAGDTTVGHTTAFVNLWESLCGYVPDPSLDYARTLALELERIAVHTGDLAAICGDIAYQLGNAVLGRLRTPMINFFQEWGGSRLAKGLIRAGKINYPFNQEHADRLNEILKAYEPDFGEITEKLFRLPSALSRMEKTGVVSYNEVLEIGTVGMAARMSGLKRDIRTSHPYNLYGKTIVHQPVLKHHGDVYSRAQIRKEEIKQSIGYLKKLIANVPEFNKPEDVSLTPASGKFVLSLIEGWRGEICHCAITDDSGNLVAYKIKDPSHHNWMALAQAVRNNDISDFPICNKSFNFSYSGHDL